jgi:hypothetical protein
VHPDPRSQRVCVTGGWESRAPSPAQLVETGGFVRPRLQDGRLVVTVCPGEGAATPFEQPVTRARGLS